MELATYIADMANRATLAAALGTSPDYVWQLATNWQGRKVPLDRCLPIERATSGVVRCEEIRPDVVWHRDSAGTITGYTVPVATSATKAA